MKNTKTEKERYFSRGLSLERVKEISAYKKEPTWMLKKRIAGFKAFQKIPLPTFGPDLSQIDFDNIYYFKPALETPASSWEEVPKGIKEIYEKLELPEFEQRFLAGLTSQYESQIFYESLKKRFEQEGVIFCSTDEAVKKYPQLIKKYFMTDCVPIADNKFTALHAAVWSGGSFIYVPKGVKVKSPLQSYFYIGSANFGQFEHTLIIAEADSSLTYIEGCTAPRYQKQSLHSAVVEIFAKESATVNYITLQNWAENIYNLNTKRALVAKNGRVNWLTISLGSAVSMVYPSSILLGNNAKSSYRGFTIASGKEIKDSGARMIHKAKNTSSEISSKSISIAGGKNTFRGSIKIEEGAKGARAHMRCDSLILDQNSTSLAIPQVSIKNPESRVTHEAVAGKLEEEQLFYLLSRGLSEREAESLLIHGFVEPIVEKLPLEYALELDRLIDLKLKNDKENKISVSNL